MLGAGGRFFQTVAASLFRFLHIVAYVEGLSMVDNLSWRPKQALLDRRAVFDTLKRTCSQKVDSAPVDRNVCTEWTYNSYILFCLQGKYHISFRE